ncbi:hypothetical protein LRB11_16130 [Ectothiorhodospira haloalkaliphila]|uniref:hypothetical protein n=1 Tax=Ectothiorhodospira haloalkaliphila TaxID=421628 RepID=UPI001EE7D3E1|nr:hypothetical protein [Ectothiorhodospira haloalkaliphila]MCG5526435.1 hypothetical protein [Ectothiorhodospira haloalkaliphila]
MKHQKLIITYNPDSDIDYKTAIGELREQKGSPYAGQSLSKITRSLLQNALHQSNLTEVPRNRIIRSIEFAPEYMVAGTALLNYFSNIVAERYNTDSVTVRIEQRRNKVTLIINTKTGEEIQRIEEDLDNYGKVLSGQLAPSDFSKDPISSLRLENQLRLTQVQMEMERRIHGLESGQLNHEVRSLQQQVSELKTQVAASLHFSDQTMKLANESAKNLSEVHSILRETLQKESERLNEEKITAIKQLIEEVKSTEPEEIKETLYSINKESKSFIERLKDASWSASTSAAGRLLYDALCRLPSLPF